MEKQRPTKIISYLFIYGVLANIFFMFVVSPLKAEEYSANVVNYSIVYVRMPLRGNDYSSPIGANGDHLGKFTHPSAMPNNHLLVIWPLGPVNNVSGNGRPTNIPAAEAGIYLVKQGSVLTNPADPNFISIKNNPSYNEVWPLAVVSYQATHGQTEPDKIVTG
jgi:hypothetical protein